MVVAAFPLSASPNTAVSPAAPMRPADVSYRPGTLPSAQLFAFVQKPSSAPVQW